MIVFLFFSLLLLVLGSIGIFICRKNVILAIMCLEVMLFSVTLNFVCMSEYLGDLTGQLFALFILTISAAESAIGLALVILYKKHTGNIYRVTTCS